MTEFFQSITITYYFEIIAALVGLIYISKRKADTYTKYLVYFLLFTVVIETIGAYAGIAYLSGYKYFSYVENTPYMRNYWLYNVYLLISFFFYISYFRSYFVNNRYKMIISALLICFLLTATLNLILSDVYLVAYSTYTVIVGTILLSLTVGLYYFRLLRSDEVLNVGRLLPFYVSIGVVIFHLCLTPTLIFSGYYSASDNKEFVDLYGIILKVTNVLMYGTFIIGFIACSREKTSSL